jgi:hypothetical protein
VYFHFFTATYATGLAHFILHLITVIMQCDEHILRRLSLPRFILPSFISPHLRSKHSSQHFVLRLSHSRFNYYTLSQHYHISRLNFCLFIYIQASHTFRSFKVNFTEVIKISRLKLLLISTIYKLIYIYIYIYIHTRPIGETRT